MCERERERAGSKPRGAYSWAIEAQRARVRAGRTEGYTRANENTRTTRKHGDTRATGAAVPLQLNHSKPPPLSVLPPPPISLASPHGTLQPTSASPSLSRSLSYHLSDSRSFFLPPFRHAVSPLFPSSPFRSPSRPYLLLVSPFCVIGLPFPPFLPVLFSPRSPSGKHQGHFLRAWAGADLPLRLK